jgi:hypothetical protein
MRVGSGWQSSPALSELTQYTELANVNGCDAIVRVGTATAKLPVALTRT